MASLAMDYAINDLICACIARHMANGAVPTHGIAAPLVMAGYLLAARR
jgi:hypothetical protein